MSLAPVAFFPVRHHSPACAAALARALDELRPTQVLVEAPADFAPLVPLLMDAAARPPLAIVSLPAVGAVEDSYIATYPFCAHSPEFVALRWARAHDARAVLIDLPARHPDMRGHAGPTADERPTPLIAEWRLDHSAYVTELCARRGVADALALWDALFESQGGTADWRGFFESVGLYCRHTREATEAAEIAADRTLAREAHMAARLAEAVAAADGPVAVVTGGFHTPALEAALAAPPPAAAQVKAPAPNAFLIRYGYLQLDRRSGYGAGLPHPAWYERLWRAFEAGTPSRDAALDALTEFAQRLRRQQPQLALATPTLAAALTGAERLAALRELPAPGRTELIDAVRSAGVKDALEAGGSPLLTALHDFLTGDAIGELPPGVGQPPLVEAVRGQARALGFSLDDGARRSRDLDILRRPRHAAASRFLFALDLAGAGFATRVAGPDPLTGWRGEALFETWTYAWSPMVESQLIARSAEGQSLEAVCLAELARRHGHLASAGRARSAAACVALLTAAVRTGMAPAIDCAVGWCEAAVAEDPDPASLVGMLAVSAGLARPGPGAPDLAPRFAALRTAGFRRLVLLFPDIVGAREDQLPAMVRALAELGALAASDDAAIDARELAVAVQAALETDAPPALAGALAAFAGLVGALTPDEVAARIAALMAGAYLDGGAAAALTGALTVSPRLIVHSEPLLAAVDSFFRRVDQDAFVATLPELRLAFSQLTPGEVDRVAGWAASRHGLAAAQLLDASVAPEEAAANMRLSARLQAAWREDGLGDWFAEATG
jgi:hypothetical protein